MKGKNARQGKAKKFEVIQGVCCSGDRQVTAGFKQKWRGMR
jgi:hypothetical protein